MCAWVREDGGGSWGLMRVVAWMGEVEAASMSLVGAGEDSALAAMAGEVAVAAEVSSGCRSILAGSTLLPLLGAGSVF